jgi:hypothetical protein
MMSARKYQKRRKRALKITKSNKILARKTKEKSNNKRMKRKLKWQPGILKTCPDSSESFTQA